MSFHAVKRITQRVYVPGLSWRILQRHVCNENVTRQVDSVIAGGAHHGAPAAVRASATARVQRKRDETTYKLQLTSRSSRDETFLLGHSHAVLIWA